MENSEIAWTKKGRQWVLKKCQSSPSTVKELTVFRLYYTWLSNQLKYFSSDTASTAIGINPWYTPQISEHCP